MSAPRPRKIGLGPSVSPSSSWRRPLFILHQPSPPQLRGAETVLWQGMGEEASPGTMMGLHGPPGQGMWVPDEIPVELPSHSSEGEEEEEPTSEGGEPLYSSSSEVGATEQVLARRERAATRRRAHSAGEAFEG